MLDSYNMFVHVVHVYMYMYMPYMLHVESGAIAIQLYRYSLDKAQ